MNEKAEKLAIFIEEQKALGIKYGFSTEHFEKTFGLILEMLQNAKTD